MPRRCKNALASAPAARFSTPTALYHAPTHRAAEDRIKNEREQQESSQGPVPKKEAPGRVCQLCLPVVS